MLCYIDLEHESCLQDPQRRNAHLLRRMGEKLRFEALSGLPCLILRYPLVAQGWVARLCPAAIMISGTQSDWSLYDADAFDALLTLIRDWKRPQIGFCGGHQLIAHAFGAPIGPIRTLHADETDPLPDFGPGLFKEIGVQDITLVRRDPLFDGLPDPFRMAEDHYWEVKALPPELERLAESSISSIQAFRHRARHLYGTQFHPERYDAVFPHGRLLLQNFFRLVLDGNEH